VDKGLYEKNLSWVSWEEIVVPKEMVGWGIKNVHCFGRALVEKCAWRIIEGKGL
jgi:hypothetical protein